MMASRTDVTFTDRLAELAGEEQKVIKTTTLNLTFFQRGCHNAKLTNAKNS